MVKIDKNKDRGSVGFQKKTIYKKDMLIEDDADAEKNMDDDEDRQLIYNGAFLYILQYIDEYSAQPDEIVTSLYSLSLFLFKKKKKKKKEEKESSPGSSSSAVSQHII